MVTIIPKDIHVEIISVEVISIIVATSPTVINSVTFIVFFSASFWAKTSSDFNLWESLLPFLYLAPLEDDLPCNFSKVSRICFWTSTSDGSLATGLDLPDLLNVLLLLDTDGFTGSLEILILFLLEAGLIFGVVGLGLLNFPKSILSPTVFKKRGSQPTHSGW